MFGSTFTGEDDGPESLTDWETRMMSSEEKARQAAPEAPTQPTAWIDRDGRMIDALRDFIEGMSVSMDVSTGDHDAGHRYFGIINEVMDDDGDKNGVTLLVYDAQPNFVTPADLSTGTAPEAPASEQLAQHERVHRIMLDTVGDLAEALLKARDWLAHNPEAVSYINKAIALAGIRPAATQQAGTDPRLAALAASNVQLAAIRQAREEQCERLGIPAATTASASTQQDKQQAKVSPPFAAPASQHDADRATTSDVQFLAHWDSVCDSYGFGAEFNTAFRAAEAAWNAACICCAQRENKNTESSPDRAAMSAATNLEPK
jgi:hypothetical protein